MGRPAAPILGSDELAACGNHGFLTPAIERLVELYIAIDKADEAAKWQKALDELNSAANAQSPPTTDKAKLP